MINQEQIHSLLPAPGDLQRQLPLSAPQAAFVRQTRTQIREILQGRSPRKLLIVGPCSIHDIAEAREYATRLVDLSSRIQDKFLVVMRTYFEKPRTALGWKGLLYDPHLNGQPNLTDGLHITRKFLLELAACQLPTATEFLDPFVHYYIGDLISWGCVGARTTGSQIHRQMASLLPLPIGFKNPIDGECQIAMHSIASAATAHTLLGLTAQGQIAQIQSNGNRDCHLVLRGSEYGPNYDENSVRAAVAKLESMGLPTQLLIDCAHDNSGKDPRRQAEVFVSVLDQMVSGNPQIAGLLMESYLHAGNQPLPNAGSAPRYGISLTDACMDWQSTEALILEAYSRIDCGSYVLQ